MTGYYTGLAFLVIASHGFLFTIGALFNQYLHDVVTSEYTKRLAIGWVLLVLLAATGIGLMQ